MEPFLALLPARVRTIVTALPTYLAAGITILTVLAEELFALLPDNAAAKATALTLAAIVWLTGVINTIRRLTPADPQTFGLLPPPAYDAVRDDMPPPQIDAGAAFIRFVGFVLVVAAVLLVLVALAARA